MALITCPECGQSVSDKATKCPNCGYPLDGLSSQNAVEINSYDIQKKPKSKIPFIVLGIIVVIALAGAVVFFLTKNSKSGRITVSNIDIPYWRLIESSDYSKLYEGEVTTSQEKPFIAVIGKYNDAKSISGLVYMNEGKGIFHTTEFGSDNDSDPSLIYRPIGFLAGTELSATDFSVTYKDHDYSDYDILGETDCSVDIEFKLNSSKSGILIFDLHNLDNDDTEYNLGVIIENGTGQTSSYLTIPLKARGVKLEVNARLFCEYQKVSDSDYTIIKEFEGTLDEGSYFSMYYGEEVLSFPELDNGFVIFSRKLIAGGNKEDRNKAQYDYDLLIGSECTIRIGDLINPSNDEPKYEISVIGYIPMHSIKAE